MNVDPINAIPRGNAVSLAELREQYALVSAKIVANANYLAALGRAVKPLDNARVQNGRLYETYRTTSSVSQAAIETAVARRAAVTTHVDAALRGASGHSRRIGASR